MLSKLLVAIGMKMPAPGRTSKLRLKLRSMVRPGGYCVLAGTRSDLNKGIGLAVAQFPESVSPTLYQSRHQAKKRALILMKGLRETGEFE